MTSLDSQLDLDLVRQKAKESFYFFAKGVLGFDWLTEHIHLDVCNLIQDATHRRQLFVLPRGWLKTTICTISYPIWLGVYNPNIRVLLAQNNQVNARAKLKVIRQQFEGNALLRALYPEVLPTKASVWSADSLTLNRTGSYPEGTFDAIGVRGQATSRHYNVIIEDDTVAPDFDELGNEMLAPTHEDIQKAVNWHRLCLPLLTNVKTDQILIVGTRWYEYDLISEVVKRQPEFDVVTRSCRENEKGESDPCGKVTYPERFDAEVLQEFENTLGPYFFSTLMLNHPVATGDMVFKANWFKEYEVLPPRQSLMVWTTLDPATDPELATSRIEDVDYSVVMTTGKDVMTGNIYVLDYFRERCNPGEHAAALFDHVVRWRPSVVGYEDVAYQRSLDYWLKELMRQHQQYFLLEPIKRTGRKSKETHIMGLQPVAANGAIHVRPYMKELISEFLTFPRGRHDDLIDALAMHLQLWRRTKTIHATKRDPVIDYTIGGAIDNIRARKKSHKDNSVVFAPLSHSSTIYRN